MPKLTTITSNDTCFYCGRQAQWISFNSKKLRCEEKSNRCPAIIKKMQNSRNANTTAESRKAHMKRMSQRGNAILKELHKDTKWLEKKSKNISKSVKKRGGHKGNNNPMYGRLHKTISKKKMIKKANHRGHTCYLAATATKIAKGLAIPKEQKTQWQLYREKVLNYTYKSWHYHQNKINPLGLSRGKEYELDHKFSITEGFKQNISPEIIGHYSNLQMLPKNDNRSKRIKCSITLDELMRQYLLG